eukprot:scaffold1252_cov124-Isochrysis_galbana.AAC.7
MSISSYDSERSAARQPHSQAFAIFYPNLALPKPAYSVCIVYSVSHSPPAGRPSNCTKNKTA